MGRPTYEAPTREYTHKHTQTQTNTQLVTPVIGLFDLVHISLSIFTKAHQNAARADRVRSPFGETRCTRPYASALERRLAWPIFSACARRAIFCRALLSLARGGVKKGC